MMSENYEKAFGLKEQNLPSSFFKYRGLSELSLDNLTQNYIWCAEINTLNDPFECSLQFDNDECLRHYFSDEKFHEFFKQKFKLELTKSEIKELTQSKTPYKTYIETCCKKKIVLSLTPEQQLKKIQERWEQIREESNQYIKICSFSEINDSLLLWSHYADQHKGICVEYDLVNEDKIRPFLQPIVYSEKIFKIGLLEELDIIRKIGSTLIKSKDWEYEAEWRYTYFRQGPEFLNKIPIGNPIAVYLGTRFDLNSTELKDQLFHYLENRKIPFFHMKRHPLEYRLIK
ncbi:MAG: DUF2971 domain-containing protein [Candidatus Pedobacter colombiensis]|uniref:DUF2971 domain-containing protein n=1 Tax=Candidatus Pedobacter colombiensis TaxID=3121371 RepID=A0AAJ5W3L1_9SPHI|nr:DUF2971 domain-containing protein [Pedobacter sp.]WEK17888.1 MAG: DUF2971 domain-containing protein [Pedobacter sp.]